MLERGKPGAYISIPVRQLARSRSFGLALGTKKILFRFEHIFVRIQERVNLPSHLAKHTGAVKLYNEATKVVQTYVSKDVKATAYGRAIKLCGGPYERFGS